MKVTTSISLEQEDVLFIQNYMDEFLYGQNNFSFAVRAIITHYKRQSKIITGLQESIKEYETKNAKLQEENKRLKGEQ